MAPGGGLYESPDKIGLAEPKKSPDKDPFGQNIPLSGLSGVLKHTNISFKGPPPEAATTPRVPFFLSRVLDTTHFGES